MKTAYNKYICSLLLFGTNGIVASLINLSSYEIVFLRTLLGSLLLLVLFKASKQSFTFTKYKKQSAFLVLSGIAMGASWLFLYEAYQQVGVSVSSLAYYCGPVIVMVLSPILFKERLTRSKTFGFFTVILGIFFVNGTVTGLSGNIWGLFCGAMSAFMFAFMVIFNKKATPITGMENATLQLIVSFLTVAVFVGIKQGYVIHIDRESLIPILVLGVVNTGIGCYLYFSPLAKLPIQTLSVLGYLEPLSAVIFSALILKESFSAFQALGAVLIIGGAAFAECSGLLGKYRQKMPSIIK